VLVLLLQAFDIILEAAMSVGVSQRGASSAATADASSQLGEIAQIWLGTFNFGIAQAMLMEKNALKVTNAFERVVAHAVEEDDLDVVLGCKAGGRTQGLRVSKGMRQRAQV
jgi:hypothetical protein